MHLDGGEGGEDSGWPAETSPRPGFFEPLLFLPGSEGGDQDGKVANTQCNTVLNGTWVTTTNASKEGKKKRRLEFARGDG